VSEVVVEARCANSSLPGVDGLAGAAEDDHLFGVLGTFESRFFCSSVDQKTYAVPL
jgi:hypothetical protein